MTLRRLLLERQIIQTPDERKMFCPFHNDVNNPSAVINPNSIHCFVCSKTFYLPDLEVFYGVKLEKEVYQVKVERKEFGFLLEIPPFIKE